MNRFAGRLLAKNLKFYMKNHLRMAQDRRKTQNFPLFDT